MRHTKFIKAKHDGRESGFEPVIAVIFLIFSSFLMFHTFGYDPKTHTILIASRLWSDFGSHIPLIRSFSMGTNWPPEYPIFPGEPIRYHFLFYAFVGILEKAGLRLDWALNLPSAMGLTLLLWGIWSLVMQLFKNARIAALSIVFFLFNGSLAFLKFFAQHPLSWNTPIDIIRASAFPAFGPWDNGLISAFWNLNVYTNQRHLALAFAIGIWFLVSVASGKNTIIAAVFWGLLIGTLPYFHQPMLLIMAVLLITSFLLFPRMRLSLLITGGISLILIAPQLLTMPKSESFLYYPGYLIHDRLTFVTFLSYWFSNLGLHMILIPLGFFFVPNRAKKVLVSLFLIFLVSNLFKFSMEVTANHKFFNFALILGNMITAYVIVRFLSSLHVMKIIKIILTLMIVIALTLSGLIDFFVVINDTKGVLADVGNNETATWIVRNTPRSAIFLNSSFLYHPASIAGRKIFMGWPYFPWSAGYDTYGRMVEMKTMYESKNPQIFCPLLEKHAISYITVEDANNDANLPNIDTKYFEALKKPVFTNTQRSLAIYATTDLCS